MNIKIDPTWQPTPEAINALPEPLCRFIMEMETLCTPADLVRQNIIPRSGSCRS